MKKYSFYLSLLAVSSLMISCNAYDFEQEQYQHEVNLLQNAEGVYDRQVIDLTQPDKEVGNTLYLVAGLSGSQPSHQDYVVTLIKSDSLFNAYNKSIFDIETDRYAKLLPTECYEEPSLQMTIKAGEELVKFPFKIKNFDLLSPDSIYMLNYEISPDTKVPFNNKKRHVLLRIHWKNEFASTAEQMPYNYTSTQVVTPATTPNGTATVRRPTHSLVAFPMGKSSVRFMAGDETYDDYTKALPTINQKSIVINVGEQMPENPSARAINIVPYHAEELEVVMLTPLGEYDNTFLLNKVASLSGGNATYYKEFRLHYKYRILKEKQNDGSFQAGPYKEVTAKLRYQFNPRADQL